MTEYDVECIIKNVCNEYGLDFNKFIILKTGIEYNNKLLIGWNKKIFEQRYDYARVTNMFIYYLFSKKIIKVVCKINKLK